MATYNLAHTCENCGKVIDRDLNAAINLRNYGFKQIGMVNPESTPVEMEALVYSSSIGINETFVDEAGISECSHFEHLESSRR